jgi:tetratricopeptide (TPR) repeat protein
MAKAKTLFVEGVQFYERGEYGAAIASFRDAWEISCKAQIMFNIARAHEALGEVREAIDAYQRYLDAGEGVHDVETVKRKIEELKTRL